MVVAVQKELTGLLEELRQKGYKAVVFGQYKAPIDALIYESKTFSVSNLLDQPRAEAKAGQDEEHGVLLVDATGKTIQEIENILNRKLYSPLF